MTEARKLQNRVLFGKVQASAPAHSRRRRPLQSRLRGIACQKRGSEGHMTPPSFLAAAPLPLLLLRIAEQSLKGR